MTYKIVYPIIVLLILTSCLNKPTVIDEIQPVDLRQESTEFLFEKNEEFKYLLKFQKESTAGSLGFKGNVAKVTQTNYWYKKQNEETIKVAKKLKTTIYEFNENRQLTLNNIYADDEELFFINKYSYDDGGFMTASFKSNKARFVVKTVPIYSQEGIIMKEEHFNSDGIKIGESDIDISLKDRILTKTTTWSHANSKNRTVSKIDLNANLTLGIHYEASLTKEFNPFAETVEEYWYDEMFRVVKENQYTPWGIEAYKNRLKSTIEYSYNDQLLEEKSILQKGKSTDVYRYTYIVDTTGNWTEKTIIKNGEKESQIQRDIQYY